MARPHSTAGSASRNAPAPAAEPGTLVRLRAAAAAVGVDEEELKRRAAAAGVKFHTVVRAGEAQAALDLNDVWRLRTDIATVEPVGENASGLEVSRLATRLEKESEEHRARHAEALERMRHLEDSMRAGEQALRVEKSRQAQLEAQLSESARTLAETQRSLMELRATQTAREKEFRVSLDEERKTSAGAAAAIEAAKLQAESASGARAHAEKRLEAAATAQSELKEQLSAAKRENEKLAKELAEVKALRTKLGELEGTIVKLNATVAREQADAKTARDLAAAKEADALRLDKECKRLAPFEKRLAEEQELAKQAASAAQEQAKQALSAAQEQAKQALSAAQEQAKQTLNAAREEHAKEISSREAAEAKHKSALEQKLKEAQAALTKADAARGIFERELTGSRTEVEKLEETCARATLERDRFKQRSESLTSQLGAALEGERAIQRYADRKEAELASLREELGKE